MELKEQGRYGTPDTGLFGKCERCGLPVARAIKLCLNCRRQALLSRRQPRPRYGLVVLLIVLSAWGVYLLITRKPADGTQGVTGSGPARLGEDAFMHEGYQAPPEPIPREAPASSPVENGVAPAPAPSTVAPPAMSRPAATVDFRTAPDGTPGLTVETAICPACTGKGRLAYDPPRKGTYTCPVCAGRGRRIRRYLAGYWKPCTTCQGMGARPILSDHFRTRNIIVRETCPDCSGKGLVPVD